MFVDASALCAMLMNEEDAEALSSKLHEASKRIISPMAVWEAAVSTSKGLGSDLNDVELDIERYLHFFKISVVAINPEMTSLALDAYRRYGKGRHPAGLNFGDCFAYACAKHHKVPLLYKGDDFSQTDIESA
jgi:ribonuclease VapC